MEAKGEVVAADQAVGIAGAEPAPAEPADDAGPPNADAAGDAPTEAVAPAQPVDVDEAPATEDTADTPAEPGEEPAAAPSDAADAGTVDDGAAEVQEHAEPTADVAGGAPQEDDQ